MTHVLFLGPVGLNWPKPVHYHYSQDTGHLMVQFKGNSFWCLFCTNVYDSPVYQHGVWNTDSNGHRPLDCYMQTPVIYHDPHQQGGSHSRYCHDSEIFNLSHPFCVSHLAVIILWCPNHSPHLLWACGNGPSFLCQYSGPTICLGWLLFLWDIYICMCLHLESATRRNQDPVQCLNASKHSSTIALNWCISSTDFLNQLEKGLWETSIIIFLPSSHVHSHCLIIQMCHVYVIQPWFPQLTKLTKGCCRLACFNRIGWIFQFQ